MIVLLHLICAFASLGLAMFAALHPSTRTLGLTAALTAGMLVSGVALVVFQHAAVIQSCISGCISLTIIVGLSLYGHLKLARK